jgi:ABC-type anion transport system duplicated permease subunit
MITEIEKLKQQLEDVREDRARVALIAIVFTLISLFIGIYIGMNL